MAKNMIDSLGREWFARRLAGAHLLYDGKVCALIATGRENCTVRDISTDEELKVPNAFFTGFKVFAYPALGYRPFGNNLAVFLKKKHSWNRGLRPGCIYQDFSPVTAYVINKYAQEVPADQRKNYRPPRDLMGLVFKPGYARPADIRDLLNGDRVTVVLNQDVLVEPNMNKQDSNDYLVYFRERPAASITEDGRIHWFSEEYKQALENVVRPRGSW